MIDLHFHCLPGIDDGPESLDDAVGLCRAAERDGTTLIVATPHVLRGSWINDDPAARHALVDQLNEELGGSPRIVAGCEVWYSDLLIEEVEMGAAGPIETLALSRYLLVEFSPSLVPPSVEGAFHELRLIGRVPLIAHPERNRVLMASIGRLEALVSAGALVQVTAGSLTGQFGYEAERAAKNLVKRGLCHVVASDAHHLEWRPPGLSGARAVVRALAGEEAVSAMFEENPLAIVENRPLHGGEEP